MAGLAQEIANNSAQLLWSVNPGLCRGVLGLLVQYAKLTILLTGELRSLPRLTSRSPVISIYEPGGQGSAAAAGVDVADHKEFTKKKRIILAAHAKVRDTAFPCAFAACCQRLMPLPVVLPRMPRPASSVISTTSASRTPRSTW